MDAVVVKPWKVYILQCNNGNLYVGITNDLERRFATHASGKGSRSVRMAGGPEKFVWSVEVSGHSEACTLEYVLKDLSRKQRDRFVSLQPDLPHTYQFLKDLGLVDDGK